MADTGLITFSIMDESKELGTVAFHTPPLGIGNVETYTSDLPTNAMGDMRLALNPLVLGNHWKRTVTAVTVVDTTTYPTNANAQRERKARVTYIDSEGGKYHIEIPTYSMVGKISGQDDIDLTQSDWANFVTRFETDFVSPAGHPITVLSAKHVGRKN